MTDIFARITEWKRKRNAVILAHYYQDPDIQDVADYIGDSLGLSQQAAATQADVIVFAGVHFMAETAKILSPEKTVLLPDLSAGCSLADACPADAFRAFKAQHPGAMVVTYVNCSAAVKAESDIICTSSNAVKIVKAIPEGTPIIFAPDRNLGAYVSRETGRDLILWNGTCQVHEIFSRKKLIQLQQKFPQAKVLAHPECEPDVLELADFVGSTSAMLDFSIKDSASEFIVATEAGILHQMQKKAPHKQFIPAPPNNNCACNECPHMKKNTLEKLLACLETMQPQIHLEESLRLRALQPIQRMLEISR